VAADRFVSIGRQGDDSYRVTNDVDVVWSDDGPRQGRERRCLGFKHGAQSVADVRKQRLERTRGVEKLACDGTDRARERHPFVHRSRRGRDAQALSAVSTSF
jgi:hypothetical protein